MTADAVPLLELDAVGVRFGGVRALERGHSEVGFDLRL